MPSAKPRNQLLRRYPALVFVAIAAGLALLLPSALNLPLSGPSTLAEYAPVSGEGRGQGDVSSLGQASSGGVGFGSGRGSSNQLGSSVESPAQRRPKLKRCVGNPPRQTEDPLSPPCVAYFEGPNGGATTRGVSPNEVRVVIYGGPSATSRLFDLDDPDYVDSDPQTESFNQMTRGLARFFNDRYQTYGRHVHFYGYKGGSASNPQTHSAVVEEMLRVSPFAIVSVGLSPAASIAKEGALREVVSASYAAFERRLQSELAPLLISYAPDIEDEARIAGSFVCTKLLGNTARYSGNPTDRSRVRKFGVLYQDSTTEPEHRLLKEAFTKEIQAQCGMTGILEGRARTTNEGLPDYAQNIGAMRLAEVTTIIGFSSSTGPSNWGAPAQQQGYFPEWVIPGKSSSFGVDDNSNGRTYPPAFWRNAFGLSYDYRRATRSGQLWYRAFREGCSNCSEPPSDIKNPQIYDTLNLLFWGIQAAGPRLTPATMDKGLHAIRPRPSTEPSNPAAYFSQGNYSWLKDAMGIWWDGTGEEPGGSLGCYRLSRDGFRYRAGEWPAGDGDIQQGPCQGPVR